MVTDKKSTRVPDKHRLNTLSFFSGAMGLDNGLERVGINTLMACEFDKASRETITVNCPDIGLIGDITAYSSSDILAYAGLSDAHQVDLIVGGPPCQAFSTAGKRKGFDDARGNVFLKYLDIVSDIRPRYVVIENVRGLMSSDMTVATDDTVYRSMPIEATRQKGAALYYVKKRLEGMGYAVSFNLYNAANFGTPQIRERVVIIGTLDATPVPHLQPTHAGDDTAGLPRWRTFREAVANLPQKQTYIPYQEKRLRFLRLLGPGQNWRDLPTEIQPEAMGKSYLLEGGKTGFYRRLAWDKPAPTLVTHPTMPATDLAHPEAERPLSIEEYKRIQEFPDDWQLGGKLTDQYKQIGNAVPVSLGIAIGRAILSHYHQVPSLAPANFAYSRYKNTADHAWTTDFEASVQTAIRKDEQLTLSF